MHVSLDILCFNTFSYTFIIAWNTYTYSQIWQDGKYMKSIFYMFQLKKKKEMYYNGGIKYILFIVSAIKSRYNVCSAHNIP